MTSEITVNRLRSSSGIFVYETSTINLINTGYVSIKVKIKEGMQTAIIRPNLRVRITIYFQEPDQFNLLVLLVFRPTHVLDVRSFFLIFFRLNVK